MMNPEFEHYNDDGNESSELHIYDGNEIQNVYIYEVYLYFVGRFSLSDITDG